jgi:type I restriction enzyme S subunit
VKLFPIPLPPVGEQSLIAEHLEQACDELDIFAREASSATALLQERRSALISAAVTGQIDVRGLAGSEAA